MLKNAKTEYSEEHEEIATYTAIETLAEAVGDKETAKLARGIRREEERMARFLERQIPTLTRAVTQEEIPASERRTNGGRRRRSSRTRSRRSS
jgi:ferritin-like metal-binding protein YciE